MGCSGLIIEHETVKVTAKVTTIINVSAGGSGTGVKMFCLLIHGLIHGHKQVETLKSKLACARDSAFHHFQFCV